MRRFRFRFQRILEVKERIEEARRIALGEATAVLNRERDRLEALHQIRRRYRQASAVLTAAPLDPGFLSLNVGYLQRLQREIGEQEERIRQVEVVVEERRQRLLAASRDRRTYEILKEKALEAHREEQLRRERMQLDEVGEQLHARRQAELALHGE
ncbi:MAG: flagellar export protein FliJ [Candidatus Latescibacterota bacterium]|jgi:flagellar FliJ protein